MNYEVGMYTTSDYFIGCDGTGRSIIAGTYTYRIVGIVGSLYKVSVEYNNHPGYNNTQTLPKFVLDHKVGWIRPTQLPEDLFEI